MIQRYALLFASICMVSTARADHFAGGSITTRCVGGNFHEITLQLFRNCGGPELLPQTLGFTNDCGVIFEVSGLLPESVVDVSPLCATDLPNSTCNGGNLIGYDLTTYRTTVFLSPCANWNVNWNTCCRNSSINVNSTPGLWIETTLSNTEGTCRTSPEFVNNTIPLVCLGQPVSYDGSAVGAATSTLEYRLIDARFGAPGPLPVIYSPGYTGTEPFTGMEIDSLTGLVTFIPTLTGAIVTVIEVTEIGSDGIVIGTVMRDLLFIVSACDNVVPSVDSGTFTTATGGATITDERALLVCGEAAFCASLAFADADVSQTLTLSSNVDENLLGATIEVTGTNPIDAELCWNTTGVLPGIYQFTVTVSDDACPVVGLQQFAYTVTVAAGGDAGEDATASFCSNSASFALVDSLLGTPSLSGTWTTEEGLPFSGIFTPGDTEPGIFNYSTGDPSACADTATVVVTLLAPTDPLCILLGVSPIAGKGFSLYRDLAVPGRWLVQVPTSSTYDLVVLASDGRLVETRRIGLTAEAAYALDLGALRAGAYVVRVFNTRTGGSWSGRSIVE